MPDGGKTSGHQNERTCERTGLRLVRSQEQLVHRVAKTSYGSMKPRVPEAGEDPLRWGRWDVVGHRTAYAASQRQASYGETLAAHRHRLGSGMRSRKLSDFFSGVSAADDVTVDEQVRQDWEDRNYIPPGVITQGWRVDRSIYKMRLPSDGWFIDIEAARSMTYLSRSLEEQLADLGVRQLSVAELRGDNRRITSLIATQLHALVLDRGEPALGIRFGSKLGSDWECWAVWLRATDDGAPEKEGLREESGGEIRPDDPDLLAVLDLFNLEKMW